MMAHVLQWEWPPWRSFAAERKAALQRFKQAENGAQSRADAVVGRLNNARDKALSALETRTHERRQAPRPPQPDTEG